MHVEIWGVHLFVFDSFGEMMGVSPEVNMGQDYSNQEIRVSFTATLPAPVLFGDLLLFQVWVHRGWNHAMVTALRVRSNL